MLLHLDSLLVPDPCNLRDKLSGRVGGRVQGVVVIMKDDGDVKLSTNW